MKRKLALLLTAAMTAASLAACGSSSASGDPAADTTAAAETGASETAESTDGSNSGSANLVMAWWGNQTRNERTQKIIDLYSEQNPGVVIDGQFSEFNDYWQKLATAAAGHSMPDIVQMDYKYLNQYVTNGLLVDLTPYVEDGTIDTADCNQDVLNSGSVNGGLYALCNGINSPALLYNKTLLDENGITVKDNMTLDEFIDVCKEVYEKTGYKTNLCYNQNEQWIEYFLRADDIVLYEDGKLGGDSYEPYADFFKLYEDGLKDGYVIDPSVFAERSIGSVEQDPLVYGSSPETMSWCAFAYSNQRSSHRCYRFRCAGGNGNRPYHLAFRRSEEVGLLKAQPVLRNFFRFEESGRGSKNPELHYKRCGLQQHPSRRERNSAFLQNSRSHRTESG